MEKESPGQATPEGDGFGIIHKFGEVSGVKMFKVRGDPHWHSSPQIALDVHNRVKAHTAKVNSENDKSKKR